MTAKRPTRGEIETALDVLLWLSENAESGADRDLISWVRFMLDRSQPWV